MGKGSRNRQLHLQEKVENPQKKQQKKQAPKWLGPVIALVLVAAILVGIVANFISDSGIIKRGRVILKSQEDSKFDITQQMATFLTWQDLYSNSYYYWYYCSYGIYQDTNNITKTYKTADQYAFVIAQLSIKELLRDSVDDVLDTLKIYIAVCDEATRKNVSLDADELAKIDTSIKELKTMQQNFGYISFDAFLDDAMGEGMKESDIRAALEMVSLYNKYTTMMQVDFEKAVTLDDLVKFRDENPEDYYTLDYIKFDSTDKALAEKLAACASVEEFKKLVLDEHLKENYKAVYNKYTTTVTATKLLGTIPSDLTDSEYGNKFTQKLNELEFDAEKTAKKDDEYFKDKTKMSDWLFNTARKKFDTTSIATDDGIYLVALTSDPVANKDTDSVKFRVKFFEFVEGDKYMNDDKFKENIFTYIAETKKDKPSLPSVIYKKSTDKASTLKATLEAKDADVAKILKESMAVTYSTKNPDKDQTTPPKIVTSAATAAAVKEKTTLLTNDGDTYYVIYVSEKEGEKYTISYVTYTSDPYYQIIDDLTTSLNKVYPTDLTANYDADAKKDTFEAWISELATKDDLTSGVRKEGDAKYFSKTDKTKDASGKETETTTYTAYMVVEPIHLDTEIVVKGGYLKYSDADAAKKANEALKTIKDKTDVYLLDALSALNTSATVSASLTAESVKAADANLYKWLFSGSRNANDSTVVNAADGKSAYIAVFSEKMEAWQSSAKTNYVSEQLQEWADGLAEAYTPNESALNKLGKPTPETTDTDTTESGSEESTENVNNPESDDLND